MVRRPSKIGVPVCVMTLLATGLFIVVLYYLLPPLWPKNFGLLDDRYYYGPIAFYLDCALHNGEFPLWNPTVYCGMPFTADPQASAYYLPQLLRGLLTPAFDPYATALSLQILLLLHLLFTGFGMYTLAREYALSAAARTVAAFVYTLGPCSIMYYSEWYVMALVLAWVPWIIWAALRAVRSADWPGRVQYLALSGLFLGASTLAGFPQLSMYIGVLIAAFFFFHGVFHFEWRESQIALAVRPDRSDRSKRARRASRAEPSNPNPGSMEHSPSIVRAFAVMLGQHALFIAGIGILGIFAAAAMLLPAYELGAYSARTASFHLTVAAWDQNRDWFHLLKNLVVFPGNTWLIQGCRAAGIGSLLAFVLALGHERRRDAAVYVAIYLVLCDCTLGPPFPLAYLLNAVDTLNITVSPWRAGIVAQFAFAMAAAFGVDAAARIPRSTTWKIVRTAILSVCGLGMFYVARRWLSDGSLFQPVFLVWILPVLALVAVCVLTWKSLPRLGTVVVAGLIAGEIVAWGAQMLPIYASSRIGAGGNTEQFGKVQSISLSNQRKTGIRPNWNMWTLDPVTTGYVPLYVGATRQLMCSPSLETTYRVYLKEYGVFAENHRGNLLLKRNFWLARQWASGALPGKEAVFPSATTLFLPETPTGSPLPVPEVARGDVEGRAVSENTQQIMLTEGPSLMQSARALADKARSMELALPAVNIENTHSVLYVEYLARAAVEVAGACFDEAGTPRDLKKNKMTPGGPPLAFPLPDCAQGRIQLRWPQAANRAIQLTKAYVLRDLSDENAKITIEERGANSVRLSVRDLPAPRLLLFVDSFYPGWRAKVDGKDTPILLADDAFKAIAVPKGTHQIEFVFRSNVVYAGVGLSVATWLLLPVLCAVFSIHRRRAKAEVAALSTQGTAA